MLAGLKPLTEHLAGKLLEAGEMGLDDALAEIRRFEAASAASDRGVGLSTMKAAG